jgi:threonylcarbamoyladenosine tRNA methylthiotransferase MtaB
MNKNTCAFYTFGCKVNQYETQLLREQFLENGFRENKDNPAFYIINGCTVTAQADRKCRNLINSLHRRHPKAKIIITGCYAKNHPEVKDPLKGSVQVIDHDQKSKLFELSDIPVSGRSSVKKIRDSISSFQGHSRAFVKIQDGCDCFCSYCIVPYMRGFPVYKQRSVIVKEVAYLAGEGFKEIVLTGINLGTWQDKSGENVLELTDLILDLQQIHGLERLRLSSIELVHVNQRLIDLVSRSDKICPHFHIPLQSGDDQILKKMNRRYSSREFLDKLKIIRAMVPNVQFTTDVMVGFPGETEENFKNTVAFAKKARFLKVHIFPFSKRAHTKAALLPDQIDKKTKDNRKRSLAAVCEKISYDLRKKLLGKNLNILFEQKTKDGWFMGYSDSYVAVKVKTNAELNNFLLSAKIVRVTSSETIGKIC